MEERICRSCSKKIPDKEQPFRGRKKDYHEKCSPEAYKERDSLNKRELRKIEKIKKLSRVLKILPPRDLREITRCIALTLRDSIYYSMVEKTHKYKSDYPEVQELINLIEEMIWVYTRKNKPTQKEMLIKYLKIKGKYEDARFWTKNYNRLIEKR